METNETRALRYHKRCCKAADAMGVKLVNSILDGGFTYCPKPKCPPGEFLCGLPEPFVRVPHEAADEQGFK